MVKYLNRFLSAALISSVAALPMTVVAQEKLDRLYQLDVIADFGGQSAAPFLPESPDVKAHMENLKAERAGRRFMASHIPVTSQLLKVGRVTDAEATEVPYHMVSRPLFIVGYDPVSIQWLTDNRDFLASNNAVGLVVSVETIAQMNELKRIVGDGVTLQPTPGDRLAQHMGIRHYPFYMDSDGVMR
jgi:integrating conjugative element protein (TIGR03765 family)